MNLIWFEINMGQSLDFHLLNTLLWLVPFILEYEPSLMAENWKNPRHLFKLTHESRK